MNIAGYAELHCLSNFSFLRGASHPGELVMRAAELGYTALAITDECSMAGAVRAYEAARELPPGSSLQLIVGAEFHTVDDLHLVLLAANQAAYAQICGLITRARRHASVKKGHYRLEQSDFAVGLDDCLALWLPPATLVIDDASGDNRARLRSQGLWLRQHFAERLWLTVQLHRGARDAPQLAALLDLAEHCALPAVAAGDVHMHRRSRRLLQDVLTATRHRCTVAAAGRWLFPNGERHLRPVPVLQRLYPAALLDETLRIAARCRFFAGASYAMTILLKWSRKDSARRPICAH